MPLVGPLRACLASLLVPLHQATVPQEFKAIFGVTDDVPESEEEYKTTQAPVQEWEDLTPEEREAAKDGLISVVGAPADVVATAKHLMQEKARKEQAASDDDFEGANPEESEDDEEEISSGKVQIPKAHSTNNADKALEASPMHALASTIRDAETEDSDADTTDPVDDAAPAAAGVPPVTGSLRGSAASATTTPMPDWPMPDLVASAETTTSGQDSVASATTTTTSAVSVTSTTTSAAPVTSTSAAPVTSATTTLAASVTTTSTSAAAVTTTFPAAAGSFDVNSIARLHTMLEAAEHADATPDANPPSHSFKSEAEDEEDQEDPSDADDYDYEASVRTVSRKNAGLAAIALHA